MARFKKDFGAFLEEDSVSLFDIMSMPAKLTGSERGRKLIFVAKTQRDNLGRILKLFGETHPDLSGKRVLLVDDDDLPDLLSEIGGCSVVRGLQVVAERVADGRHCCRA